MAGFPDKWMQELLSRTDIASVVSEYVQLREKGGRLWGLCPFHNEKTASFSVSPDRQLYYCFGCHAGGNVVHFLMELEKLSYVDTIKLLADRIRLPLPEETDDEALLKERALKEKCHEACREAALFYHRQLAAPSAHNARSYLEKRGVDAKTVQCFGLGYSGSGLSNYLLDQNFSGEVLIAAGLARESGGGLRDAFWNRLMFPIIGLNRQVVGFGGRVLGDGQPKYLNTAENVIFNKRRHLYGLNFFRKSGFSDILLVEGYMDVVSLHQYGVTNSVASLGTALTKQQARLIKRNVPRAYIAYDSDSAGQNAALKAARELLDEGVEVRVMRFPDGSDPDEFIRREGIAAFDDAKENALTFPQFRLSMLAAEYDLGDENARELYAKAACAFIRTLEPLSRERYFAAVSRETGFTIEALASQGAINGGYANIQDNNENSFSIIRNTRIARIREENPDWERAERILLCILVSDRECALSFRMNENEAIFRNEAYALFARKCIDWHEQHPDEEIEAHLAVLLGTLTPEQSKQVSGALDTEKPANPGRVMSDCLLRLESFALKQRMSDIQRKRDESTDKSEQAKLAQEYMMLNSRLRALGASAN